MAVPAAELRIVLSSDTYAREVRADEAQAHELGINGVPRFDGRFAVSGARSPQVMLRALHHAWSERVRLSEELDEGAVCGPESC